jgi:hypothetical protein
MDAGENLMIFQIKQDATVPETITIPNAVPTSQAVMALKIDTKYRFQTEQGVFYHEYSLPSNRDIQNCGGYTDKLLKYRSPRIRDFIMSAKPNIDRFKASDYPVLRGRSPQIDLILNELISRLRSMRNGRVSLFDHGCTLAEHFDMLDLLLQATTGERAQDVLSYCGLDCSPLVLSAARLFHQECLGRHFKLILAEGSEIDLPDDSFDFSISVGVVNHVARPIETLDHLLRITRTAFITAIWVTAEDEGFWAFNHSGIANYFFAEKDLAAMARKHAKGRFYTAEFMPEYDASQPSSYIGIDENRLDKIGSYILIYSSLPGLCDTFPPLLFDPPSKGRELEKESSNAELSRKGKTT